MPDDTKQPTAPPTIPPAPAAPGRAGGKPRTTTPVSPAVDQGIRLVDQPRTGPGAAAPRPRRRGKLTQLDTTPNIHLGRTIAAKVVEATTGLATNLERTTAGLTELRARLDSTTAPAAAAEGIDAKDLDALLADLTALLDKHFPEQPAE